MRILIFALALAAPAAHAACPDDPGCPQQSGDYSSNYAYGPENHWNTSGFGSGALYDYKGRDYLSFSQPPEPMRRGAAAQAAGAVDPNAPGAIPNPLPRQPGDPDAGEQQGRDSARNAVPEDDQ